MPGRGYRFVAPVEQQATDGMPTARWVLDRSLVDEPIGRESEISAIAERIAPARLVTVVGPGGIGKTTVALARGRSAERRYPDGAVLVEVSGSVSPAVGVATALGLRFPDDVALDALSAHLAPLELLLVLDGCEVALEPAARLAEAVLREAPRVSIVATSRDPCARSVRRCGGSALLLAGGTVRGRIVR